MKVSRMNDFESEYVDEPREGILNNFWENKTTNEYQKQHGPYYFKVLIVVFFLG